MAGATLTPASAGTATPRKPDARPTYMCPECGHMLRVYGLGRHRVYFELGDERSDDPVMNRVCPACGNRLPGKSAS
jgi:predicted RNA-binding Zn-ribbon protein involved in translation (DUF1610 family)